MANYDLGHLGRLDEQYDRQLQQCLQQKRHWENMSADYQALSDRLSTIADQISHEIMVPMGSLAFMPGKLIRSNEITVLLGDNWFVERSAKQATNIVKRRMITCQTMLKDLNKEEEHIIKWMKYSREMRGEEGLVDLKEEYDEDKDHKWREEHRGNIRKYKESNTKKKDDIAHEELMRHLDRLQVEEEECANSISQSTEEERTESTTNLINFKHTATTKSESHLTNSTSYKNVPLIQSPLDIYKHFGLATTETKSILKQRHSLKDEEKKNRVRFADEELIKPERDYKVTEPRTPTAFSGVIVEKMPELNPSVEGDEDFNKPASVFKQRKLQSQLISANESVIDSNISNIEIKTMEDFQNPDVQETSQSPNRPKTAFSAILERSAIEPIKPNELKECKRQISKFKAQKLQK